MEIHSADTLLLDRGLRKSVEIYDSVPEVNTALRSSSSIATTTQIGKDCGEAVISPPLSSLDMSSGCDKINNTSLKCRSLNRNISWKDRALYLEELLELACEEIARYAEKSEVTHLANPFLNSCSGVEYGHHQIFTLSDSLGQPTVRIEKGGGGAPTVLLSPEEGGKSLMKTIREALSNPQYGSSTALKEVRLRKSPYTLSPVDKAFLEMGGHASHEFKQVENPPVLPVSSIANRRKSEEKKEASPGSGLQHPIIVLDITSMFSSSLDGLKGAAAGLTRRSGTTASCGVEGEEKVKLPTSQANPRYEIANTDETFSMALGKPSATDKRILEMVRSDGWSGRNVQQQVLAPIPGRMACSSEGEAGDETKNESIIISCPSPTLVVEEKPETTTIRTTTTSNDATYPLNETLAFKENLESTEWKKRSTLYDGSPGEAAHNAFSLMKDVNAMNMRPATNGTSEDRPHDSTDVPPGPPAPSETESRSILPRGPSSSHLSNDAHTVTSPPVSAPSPVCTPSPQRVTEYEGDKGTSEKLLEKYEREIQQLRKENSLLRYREGKRIREGKGGFHRTSGGTGDPCNASINGFAAERGSNADAWRFSSISDSCCGDFHPGAHEGMAYPYCATNLDGGAAGENARVNSSASSQPSLISAKLSNKEMEKTMEEWTDDVASSSFGSNFDKEAELRRLRILMRFSYLKKDSDELELMKNEMRSVLKEQTRIRNEDTQNKMKLQEMEHSVKNIHEIIRYLLALQRQQDASNHQHSSQVSEPRDREVTFFLQRVDSLCQSLLTHRSTGNIPTAIGSTAASHTSSRSSSLGLACFPDRKISVQDTTIFSTCARPQPSYPTPKAQSEDLGFSSSAASVDKTCPSGKPPLPWGLLAGSYERPTTSGTAARTVPQGVKGDRRTPSSFSSPGTQFSPTIRERNIKTHHKRVKPRPSLQSSCRSALNKEGDSVHLYDYSDGVNEDEGQTGVSRIQQAMQDARTLASVLQKGQYYTSQLGSAASTGRRALKR